MAEERHYTNLKEVIDYNKPFNILYSGVEDESNFQILYDSGIRNFLMSYYYIQKKRLSTDRYAELGVKFFIDSGAFTFNSSLEFQDYTIEQWEKYIEQYLRWAEKNRDVVFAIANLDLEYLVGGDKVQEWNEKYFEPFMLRTGIPVCFVHHGDGTKLTWDQYCQRYPYVGISWGGVDMQGSDLNYGIQKLKVAEKYNAVVHGMAMTQTSLLTKLPFYTSDSTTWLVGLQYGEVNYWTGTKMTRLKKDKWKGPMLSQLVAKGFDEQKLLDEDKEELIKVNIYAFIEAEKYVQEKLKSRMYWMRPKATKRTEEDLENINYPSAEWLVKPQNDLYLDFEVYAKELNISTSDPDVAIDTIFDTTCFMNWDNEEYSEIISNAYTPESIKELHDTYINRIVQSDEERIEDLKKFYKDNVLGNITTLLTLGTNFDRIIKERDESEYITDEEYDYEDVSKVEIDNIFSGLLPPPQNEGDPAPEISDLDDEIFEDKGIVPIRDEQGRFLKGQRKVMRPKKLYSAKFPKMSCDSCFEAQKCPNYKAGYVCAYNKMFSRYNTRDMGDIIQAMQGIVDFSMQRLQRSMMFEVMEGGMPSPDTTNLMNQSMAMLRQLQNMYECGSQEVLRQTKVVRADGTQETTTQISNPQSGGILEKIFGGMGSNNE